ncbi:unnamed protein product, partial [Prorocentrum cordatum]
ARVVSELRAVGIHVAARLSLLLADAPAAAVALESRLAQAAKARPVGAARDPCVDFALAGRAPGLVRRRRLRQAARRAPRLRRLLGPGRRRHAAAGTFKQGVEASFSYGVCCAGLSDTDLDAARDGVQISRDQALDKAFAAALAASGSWADCRGPVEAALLSMRRMGWEELLGRSCEHWQAEQLSKRGVSWLDVGIDFGQLRRWAASGRGTSREARSWPSLSSEQRGYLRSCIVDGQWTNARKYGNNPRCAPSDTCELCPNHVGDLWHRHLCCSAIQHHGLSLPSEVALLLPQEDNAAVKCLAERVPAQQL